MLFDNLIKRSLISLLGILLCILLAGCPPRGETITLDQSLLIAKERYAGAILTYKTNVPAEVAPSLDSINSGLERLAGVSTQAGYQEEAKAIAENLRPLVTKAGYTSRAALDEILKQYVVAAEGTVAIDFAPGTAKLLAQRTYHLLSAELENTRFSL